MGIFSLSDYNEDSDNSIYNFIFKFISYVVATQNPINQLSATVQMLLKTRSLLRLHTAEVGSTAGAGINMCSF